MSTPQTDDLHERPIGEVASALTRDLSLLYVRSWSSPRPRCDRRAGLHFPGSG